MPAPRVPRILVVDDEPAIQRVVARALEEEGDQVAVVSDGQEALDAVTRADPVYDLVVTNNRMPHMARRSSGCCRRSRRTPPGCSGSRGRAISDRGPTRIWWCWTRGGPWPT